MLNAFFKWLRAGAENAILEGVADAAEKLTAEGEPLPPRLAVLAAKFTPTPALPPAEPKGEEAPAKKTKRGAE